MKRHIKSTYHQALPLLLLCLTGIIASCSKEVGTKTEDVALQAAKVYYDQLFHGDYNAFVEGSLQGDSVPAAYKQQLLLNAQMFVEQQQEAHGGIDSIIPQRATCDTIKTPQATTKGRIANGGTVVVANAYLSIKYKDNNHEEIVVPMVKKNDIWYLK